MTGEVSSTTGAHTAADNHCTMSELVSHKGTIRGIKNRVRASLATLERDEKSVSVF